ncbi:PRC-barrel domain-containing protein [Ramlibacter sp. AW1]|uniref:PRC-barrel domain-containing protein n=1 Tax=Ramlibacter aurantiacus TaxID=2801330 RepID=A0A936ZQ51_9BURK|nr:PRC-barrel domain-containing protein [Ramlibacter aurantiacus]MBL0421510.1 PRC-barrel domain-containing protein [Ramlibacter aurantiacus]
MFRSKPIHPPLAAAIAVAALAAGPSWAAAPSGEGVTASHSATARVAESRALRASRAIGMEVRGRQGEVIGPVRDVLVNNQTGVVRYLVIALGRGTAPGERVALVPASRLALGPARQSLVYEGRPQTLEKVAVPQADWKTILGDADRLAQLDKSWSLQRRTAARFMRPVSTLMGQRVTGAAGAPLGEIEDLVLNINQARPSYAVIKLDQQASGDGNRVAVPLRALQAPAGQPALALDTGRTRLDALKGFSREAYQDPNNPSFMAQASRHLGAFGSSPTGSPPAGGKPQ